MSILRRLRPLLVNKHSVYVYPIVSVISTLSLLYCMYTSGCHSNKALADNQFLVRRNVNMPNNKQLQCYLFLLILSSPKSILQRKAMRETWLGPKYYKHKVERRFVVGVKNLTTAILHSLQLEQTEHNDLLFFPDFVDSYDALTSKLLRSFVWVTENIDAKFVMKLDDDTFVRTDVLLNDLEKREHLGRLYWGFFRGNANVKRVGQWAEKDWYLSDNYLPYALGGGYVVTADLVDYVSSIADMLQLYKSEDVSMGTWLAPVKLNRIHDIRFDTEYKSRGCHNDDVVSHKQSPDDMYAKHDQLVHHNTLCREEKEVLTTFDYDWKVPPSHCCKRVKRSSLNTINN